MKRTASHGNSLGTITVTIEGYGKMKQVLGDDEFGKHLDHEADFAALVLPGVLIALDASPSGTRHSRSSFEIEQDGTHAHVDVAFRSYRPVDIDTLDSLIGGVMFGIKTHVRMHLKPDFDPFKFESFKTDLPFDRMDGGESLHDVATRFTGVRDGSLMAGLMDVLFSLDPDSPFSGLGFSAGDPRKTPWGPRY